MQRALATYGPPALLVIVACSQIYLATMEGLTPAKGGGFGLFSTIDKLNNRTIKARAYGDGWSGTGQLSTHVEFEEKFRPAMAMPSEARLREVAEILREQAYPGPLLGVEVSVLKRTFDPQTLEAGRVEVRGIDVRVP